MLQLKTDNLNNSIPISCKISISLHEKMAHIAIIVSPFSFIHNG